MSRIRTPENIEIASLKKKQQEVFDPMAAGTGTPWEDRGTHGTVGAFIKTCTASMFKPAALMKKIRRPETYGDARAFLFIISAIWGISALLHTVIVIWNRVHTRIPMPDGQVVYGNLDTTNTAVHCGLALVGGSLGCFFLFKIYNAIYGRLAAQEKGAALMPDVLLYNVNVYALGPSVLALIPFVGPPLALLWIFVGLVVAGVTRLRLSMSGAVIDALLGLIAVVAMVVGVYVIGEIVILDHGLSFWAVDLTPPPKDAFGPARP